jgi:hypothetical protein
MSAFQQASRKQAKARLALEGPAGFGKSLTSLKTARVLVGPTGTIAFVDTENRSAEKYAPLEGVEPDNNFTFEFMHAPVEPPYHPRKVIELIKDAEASGADAVILDSLSHFWTGKGGLLELVSDIAKSKYRGDSHRAWGDPAAGGLQQDLVDAILHSRIHVIACMRTKSDYLREETEKDGRKKTSIRKVGVKTVQRDEFDYEFDIVGRFESPAVLTITKSRCPELPPASTAADADDLRSIITKPGEEFARTIAAWLGTGAALPVTATPTDQKKLTALIKKLEAAGPPPGTFAELGWQAVADAFAMRDFGHPIGSLTKEELKTTIGALGEHLEKLQNGNGNGNGAGPTDDEPAAEPQQEQLA